MKKHRRFAAFLAGLAVILGSAAWSAAGAAPQAGPQERARLRERISDLYLLRLTRALDLTEEQTAKIYPLLTQAEKAKAPLQRQMGLDLRDLRQELASEAPDEGAVARLSDGIWQARRALRRKDDEVEAQLGRLLTPVQRARYVIFTADFLRTVEENLGRVRGGARGNLNRTP
jgi:Spy/CpxP family protein refolding chaperone